MRDDDFYEKQQKLADKYIDAILRSKTLKKLVIAGPGTGKSFLFKEICKDNKRKGLNSSLVLSFINELVVDLARDLYQLAEVRTLHSFALSKLPGDPKMYLDLGSVIEDDYELVHKEEIDFGALLCNLKDSPDELGFYSQRRRFYEHFGPNCSVYALIKYFEKYRGKIPADFQIMIDEYQDFNKLEARLIEILAEKNSIVIVGDDDQSLYSFKFANPDEIRAKSKSDAFTSFELPFCFRCTEVIVNSFDNIIQQAKAGGYLAKRLNKQYKYFPSAEKDRLSAKSPKILVRTGVYQTQVAFNIEREISKLFDPTDKDFSILVICSVKNQIGDLAKKLTEKGFRNVTYPGKREPHGLMDGFALLLKDKNSNLGWRIVSRYMFENAPNSEFAEIVQSSINQSQLRFRELLPKPVVKKVKSILAKLRKVKRDEELTNTESEELFECFDINPNLLCLKQLRDDLGDISFHKRTVYQDVPIKITNTLGSKGLTRGYVFLVNFDDKYLLEGKGKGISDESICKFLVALTRAKRRVYIYSNGNKLPTYVNWIDKTNLEVS